jgi:hypothetical protein
MRVSGFADSDVRRADGDDARANARADARHLGDRSTRSTAIDLILTLRFWLTTTND